MPLELTIRNFAVRGEQAQRAALVHADEPRISRYIGTEDRRETALDTFSRLCHRHTRPFQRDMAPVPDLEPEPVNHRVLAAKE